MKRLIRKSEVAEVQYDVEIGDTVQVEDDIKYKGLEMDDLSRSSNRDGALLVDTKDNVIRWGLNGETHADLLEKYYSEIIKDTNQLRYETDDYVVPAIYLKDFLGHETVIMYNDSVTGAENLVVNEKPNCRVYVDDYAGGVERIAIKRKK